MSIRGEPERLGQRFALQTRKKERGTSADSAAFQLLDSPAQASFGWPVSFVWCGSSKARLTAEPPSRRSLWHSRGRMAVPGLNKLLLAFAAQREFTSSGCCQFFSSACWLSSLRRLPLVVQFHMFTFILFTSTAAPSLILFAWVAAG